MSTSAHFNRTLFTAPVRAAQAEEIVAQLLEEDIELILDARPALDEAFAAVCAAHATHYVHQPALARIGHAEASAAAAEAATLALRHHACLLADEPERAQVANAVAAVVGMRVLDIAASPARITTAALSTSR